MPCARTARFSVLRDAFLFLLLMGFICLACDSIAQSPQPHHLEYSTYTDSSAFLETYDDFGPPLIAVNGDGQMCLVTYYLVLQVNADGTFAYSLFAPGLAVFRLSRPDLFGVAIDGSGNCYVAGIGQIAPTPGVYQSNKTTGMFVVKLDPRGNAVLATYLGGSGSDTPAAIALDPRGNIWVAGSTASTDFPVTGNAVQSSFQGGKSDAFLAELSPDGTQLLYGSYLGGNGDELPPAKLAVDAGGDLVVAGTTTSTNFPVSNAQQPNLGASSQNAFVTKINNAGQLVYSTYLGLSSLASSAGVSTDSAGNAVVIGAAGAGFPLVNPIGQTPGAFVSKLSVDGSALVYSTYFGLGAATLNSVQVDSIGDAAIALDDPPMLPPLNPVSVTGNSGVIMLDPNGTLLISSPLGDGSPESIGIDANDNLYLGGVAGITGDGVPLLRPINGTIQPYFLCGPLNGCSELEPFIAKIALGAGASFSMPAQVEFTDALKGGLQGPIPITLWNTGTTNITVNSITTSKDYTLVLNQCPAILASSLECDISVGFSPIASGTRNGTVVIADDSPGNPHIIQLAGTGLEPGGALSPGSLKFDAQGLNTTSPAQIVTLTNQGGENLGINPIMIWGTNPADFTQSNNCGQGIGPGASCTISVTFTPKTVGSSSASLYVFDFEGNQSGESTEVPLTGTGVATPRLIIPAGSINSATVTAGETATYTLSIGGGGLSGTATLTCSGAPKEATCSVPSSVNVSATTDSTFTASVTTTAATSSTLRHTGSSWAWYWATLLIGVVWLPLSRGSKRAASRATASLGLLLIMLVVSCGGGGGESSGGTPAGTYTLTVTATMSGSRQSQTLKLTVK